MQKLKPRSKVLKILLCAYPCKILGHAHSSLLQKLEATSFTAQFETDEHS